MNNQNHLSAVSTIPEACEAVMAQAEQITPSQLAHLYKVHSESEAAKENLQKVVIDHQLCLGAYNSFMVFLFAEYGLGDGDTIELETGKINRKS